MTRPGGSLAFRHLCSLLLHPEQEFFKESMGARNRGGIGLSYRPARLHMLAEFIPWNRFLGSINVKKIRVLCTLCRFQMKRWDKGTVASRRWSGLSAGRYFIIYPYQRKDSGEGGLSSQHQEGNRMLSPRDWLCVEY